MPEKVSAKETINPPKAMNIANWITVLGGNPAQAERRARTVVKAYGAPYRKYHNLAHVAQVLRWLEMRESVYPDIRVNYAALKLAAFYHDVVFVVGARDNEEKSAEYAARDLRAMHVPEKHIAQVVMDIMDTRHMDPPATHEGKLMVDADLYGLAGMFERVRADTLELLAESGAPKDKFMTGSAAFLTSLMLRESIYRSPHTEAEESAARRNLARLIPFMREQAAAA
ncbi:MAG: hypothetical protein RJB39_500 [Candidatus Parcubacteria bacterium]